MKCPRCGVALREVNGAGVCEACGGAFLPLAADGAVDDAVSSAVLAAEAGAPRRATTTPPALCPSCNARMTRAKRGAVDVDTCAAHGTWYDRGELASIHAALSGAIPPTAASARPTAKPRILRAPLPGAVHARPIGTTSLPRPRARTIDDALQGASGAEAAAGIALDVVFMLLGS